MGIFSMKKGFLKNPLQKGFLAQNRAQKGKRAIRGQPAYFDSNVKFQICQDRLTKSDAYHEPIVHWHRWAQKALLCPHMMH